MNRGFGITQRGNWVSSRRKAGTHRSAAPDFSRNCDVLAIRARLVRLQNRPRLSPGRRTKWAESQYIHTLSVLQLGRYLGREICRRALDPLSQRETRKAGDPDRAPRSLAGLLDNL